MRKLRFLAVMLLSLFLWQSTEIMAAPTAASATVDGKTVNYSYEFTESGGDVTFSITITSIKDGNGNNATIDGLVEPAFFVGGETGPQNSSGSGDIVGNARTYTWTGKTAETELTISAHYAYTGASFDLPGTGTFSYTVQGSGSATPDNLALNKEAIATSGTASSSVDGNMYTSWDSNQSDPQTWQVDLGSSKTFNAIVIYWEGAYAKTFTIEAGNDVDGETGYLTTGTPIATVTGQTLTGSFPYKQVIPVNSTTSRYIKFTGTKRANDAWSYRIWEFEVYNDASLTTSDITITSANTAAGAVNKLAGETEQFTYTAINSSSQPVTPGTRTWASSNTAVGTIDANGLFKAVGPGTTNITLTSGG